MSTRATIHFHYPGEAKPVAIVYRHSDGYPDGLGKDLKKFVKEVRENVPDNRFNDAAYLAAKWVVWDAHRMSLLGYGENQRAEGKPHRLKFLSVGIMDKDPEDIEYRYKVVCDGTPTITYKKV